MGKAVRLLPVIRRGRSRRGTAHTDHGSTGWSRPCGGFRGPVDHGKGVIAMIYGEPETPRFLAAVQRLKRLQRRKVRQTRLAKQRARAVLRKMRDA